MGVKEDRLNDAARAEGWTSRGQKYRANKAGVTDPAEWAARQGSGDTLVDDDPVDTADLSDWAHTPAAPRPDIEDEFALVDAAPADHPTLDLEGGDTGAVQLLPIDRVMPAPDNPRRVVDTDDDMVASVQAIGILQPLIVTVDPDVAGCWMIVAGHRRHAAAVAAGLTVVPALVREFTPVERVEAMLVENLQRKDLDPFDEAHGFRQLADLGRTQREIADRIGRNQSHVSRRLKLVDLEPELIEHFTAGQVTLRILEELAVLGPEVRHAAIGVLNKSPGIHESNIIPTAEKAVAQARARLEGKESGLPEWAGKRWELSTCDRPEATHWTIDEQYQSGRWIPEIRWGRAIPDDIPGDRTHSPDPAEAERRRQMAAEREAAAAALKARVARRRAFVAAHLDDLTDLAIRLIVPMEGAVILSEDEIAGALQLLGHEPVDHDLTSEITPLDQWDDLAAKATTKRQTLRMFAARVLDGADAFAINPPSWVSYSSHEYLEGLAAVGWELDDAETEIVAKARGTSDDADGIGAEDGAQ